MKEAEGENSVRDLEFRHLGKEEGGTLPQARSRWGWEQPGMKPTK